MYRRLCATIVRNWRFVRFKEWHNGIWGCVCEFRGDWCDLWRLCRRLRREPPGAWQSYEQRLERRGWICNLLHIEPRSAMWSMTEYNWEREVSVPERRTLSSSNFPNEIRRIRLGEEGRASQSDCKQLNHALFQHNTTDFGVANCHLTRTPFLPNQLLQRIDAHLKRIVARHFSRMLA